MNNLELLVVDDKLVVDSRQVAELTGKKHFHLLRDIDNYTGQLVSCGINSKQYFKEDIYYDLKNEVRRCYKLTEKGCYFIVNRRTGQKGAKSTSKFVAFVEELKRRLDNENSRHCL